MKINTNKLSLRSASGTIFLSLLLALLGPFNATVGANSGPETWWSFRPIGHPSVPVISQASNPIDSFILAKLREKSLHPSPTADRRTLIRRAAFDLLGLPPTPDQLTLPYDQAVDQFLASPQYGERWGRHWLDIVRYGETDGGEHNYERPNAWPYRDYVIGAINRDMPYNQFVREQIAGDVLFPKDNLKLAATGFLVSGPWDQVSAVLNKDPLMRKTSRMDELDDMVTTTSATFLGLTVNCARCHDHKFDPIPTRDYYRMAAAFSGAGFGERVVASQELRAEYERLSSPLRTDISKLTSELEYIEIKVKPRLLLQKYIKFDEERSIEPLRIPVNQIYNREQFAEVKARYWQMVISNEYKTAAHLDRLQLLPAGINAKPWTADRASTPDNPVVWILDAGSEVSVNQIVWSSDKETGKQPGTPLSYKFQYSSDGKSWKTVATNLNHVGRIELDLPEVTDDEINAALPLAQRQMHISITAKIAELQQKLNAISPPERLYAVNPHTPEQVSVLKRGSVATPLEPVTPGALSCVGTLQSDLKMTPENSEGARRLALAEWIVDPRNPLTARVIVNRVWYYHFGTGIVNTPSDFGANGDKPSHPELLDWLANAFMEHGWSLKWLHKAIMLSQTYQQISQMNLNSHRIDAGNRYYWRMPLKRMDAETLRDSILFTAGSLNWKAGGPGFALHKNSGRGSFIYHAIDNDGPDVWRRSVYRFVVRGGDRLFLDTFDCPDPSVATPQRSMSNTPIQALALLNNVFVTRQAEIFARRVKQESKANTTGEIERAYLLAFGRVPSASEISTGTKFIKTNSLALYCRALFNSNEFVYTP